MSVFDTHMTMQSTDQIVLEVIRIKLSKSFSTEKIVQKSIVGYVEAHYGRARRFRTKDNKLYGGTTPSAYRTSDA